MTTFTASSTPVASTRPLRAQQPADRSGWWWATGRRKTSTARVRVKPGKGEILEIGRAHV